MRHGLAASNVSRHDSVVGGYADLLPEGMAQVEAAASHLQSIVNCKAIYSSPLPRALQSAHVLAKKMDVKVLVDPRLKEIDRGGWHGDLVSEVILREAAIDIDDRPYHRPPNGENWRDVGLRMSSFINEKLANGEKNLMIVSHDHPIRMAIGALMMRPIETWEDLPIDHASVTALVRAKGQWQIDTKYFNRIFYKIAKPQPAAKSG